MTERQRKRLNQLAAYVRQVRANTNDALLRAVLMNMLLLITHIEDDN